MCIYNFDKEQSNFLKFRKQLWTSSRNVRGTLLSNFQDANLLRYNLRRWATLRSIVELEYNDVANVVSERFWGINS